MNPTVDHALNAAASAFEAYRNTTGIARAAFLRAAADALENLGDELLHTAARESSLPLARITGERGRTCGQLRMFAAFIEEGSWVDAVIDTALPERQPLPRPDVRRMLVPVGPVVVFGASNFPLAFSTAGGDTASALAAGCPVVVKAHPAHPETARLAAAAIAKAAEQTGMPEGVFAQVEGDYEVGQALVKHPLTAAVAFTGSFAGGKALFDLANQREKPIPVFAEMGSVNPVFVFEHALQQRSEHLAAQIADSVTLGVGQFCTNPGLVFGVRSAAFDDFQKQLTEKMAAKTPAPMLHEGIAQNYREKSHRLLNEPGVTLVAGDDFSDLDGAPLLVTAQGAEFVQNPNLQEEVFGPLSVLVVCASMEEMLEAARRLSGQLTATLMAEPGDLLDNPGFIGVLGEKCGRLIFNNVPTGVEVTHAMHHGGPFPATTDAHFTSVGTGAIRRFVRPLCFQNCPDELLPEALRNGNPLSIRRFVDGVFTDKAW
jgi:NADP-dependent aldehyde dehydrogenase